MECCFCGSAPGPTRPGFNFGAATLNFFYLREWFTPHTEALSNLSGHDLFSVQRDFQCDLDAI